MRTVITPTLERLGTGKKDNLSQLDTQLRTKVVGWACELGMKECTEQAIKSWEGWMEQEEPDEEGASK